MTNNPSPSTIIDRPSNLDFVGTVPSVSGLALAEEAGRGVQRTTVLTLSSMQISTTDATTSGAYGSQKVYDLPDGAVIVDAIFFDIDSISVASGLSSTATVKVAFGSAAEASDDTLNSTQADMLASTSLTALVASAQTNQKAFSTAAYYGDGSATAKDIYLNIGVADAGSTANSTVTISGTIYITWKLVGND